MTLRRRDRIALAVVAVLALLGGFYLMVLKPERQKVADLNTQIAAQKATLTQAEQSYASGRAAQTSLKADAAEWTSLRLAVPDQSDIPALLRTLQKTAAQVHVSMQAISLNGGTSGSTSPAPAPAPTPATSTTPSTTTSTSPSTTPGATAAAAPAPQATPVPVQLSFSGGYTALNHLVRRLQALVVVSGGKVHASGPLLSISNVSLNGAKSLTVQITRIALSVVGPAVGDRRHHRRPGMSSLRRDLLERKLWMIVALLVLAVLAVPLLLLKGSSAGGAALPPAPPAAGAGAAKAVVAQTAPAKATEPAKVTLARIARDPFASGVHHLQSKPGSPSASTSSSSSSTPASSPSTSTVAMVSPAPAPSSSPSGGATSTSSTTPTTPTPPTTPSSAPTSTIASAPPSTQSAQPAKVETWTMYSVDVRFGTDLRVPLRADIKRLTPLPSGQEPDVMFQGVMSNGRAAVFALRQGVGHTGPGWCHPDHDLCSAIVLKPGQTEDLTIPGPDGTLQKRMLRVVRITSSITHSDTVARAPFKRLSPPGLCDLVLAEPLTYHLDTGTYSSIPKKDACAKYPDATPFSYFRVNP